MLDRGHLTQGSRVSHGSEMRTVLERAARLLGGVWQSSSGRRLQRPTAIPRHWPRARANRSPFVDSQPELRSPVRSSLTLPATRDPRPATRDPRPGVRTNNRQPATCNPHLATRPTAPDPAGRAGAASAGTCRASDRRCKCGERRQRRPLRARRAPGDQTPDRTGIARARVSGATPGG